MFLAYVVDSYYSKLFLSKVIVFFILDGNLSDVTTPKTVNITSVNPKIVNYSSAVEIAGLCIVSVLFTTKDVAIGVNENLFSISFATKKRSGLLLPTNNGKTVQIAVTEGRILAASGITDTNITVGGILVVV